MRNKFGGHVESNPRKLKTYGCMSSNTTTR
jgi:hypothetical protein